MKEKRQSQNAGGEAGHKATLEEEEQFSPRELASRLAALIAMPGNTHARLGEVTAALHRWSGCEAVGIRLRNGADFPYYETRGFPQEFVEAESRLCVPAPDGDIERDDAGAPLLDCMCGSILNGRFDATKSFFTRRGSFWSSNTTALLRETTDADRMTRTRNRCNAEGYESVALIPLVGDGVILGLLQFNDRRPDLFTSARIEQFEILADSIAAALMRNSTETALRDKEARLHALMHAIPDLVWLKDPDGVYITCNPAFERLFGAKESEIVGRTDYDFVDRALADFFRANDLIAVEAGKPVVNEEWVTFAEGGKRVNLETIKTPMYNDEGGLIGVLGIGRDITERTRTLEDRNRLARQRQLALNAARLGWWHYDPVSMVSTWDPRYAEIFGVPGNESDNAKILTLLHPDDLPAVWAAVERALDPVNRSSYSVEYRVNRPDGEQRWVEAHGIAEFAGVDGEQHATSFVGTVQDITESKRANDALLKQSERLRSLHSIDQEILQAIETPTAIVHTALQHLRTLLQCGRASVGIFDLEKMEVSVFVADAVSDPIVESGNVLDEALYGDLDVLRTGKAEIVEDMSRTKSPSVVERLLGIGGIQSSINVPLLSVHGLHGALHIGWDSVRRMLSDEIEIVAEVARQVTIAIDQARLFEASKRHAAELERRVQERTAELEAANRELEAFAYSVSHDLRAPLRAVDGFTRVLLEEYGALLDAEGQRVCAIISNNARNMGRLIDDLLAFSRVGRAALQPSTIDMAALARGIYLEATSPEARERIDFSVGELPAVVGDPGLLRQVWVNLISNAIKFSSKRARARIDISGVAGEKEVVYSIRDDGAGFDMTYAGKLFGVFQRLHSTKEFEGTGVGLAIVQRIIHRHGGRVRAEGRTDTGATFTFSIPTGHAAWTSPTS